MTTNMTPYIDRKPGDLITAEDWNELQRKVKTDISEQTKQAIDQIKSVKMAEEAQTLQGKTFEEILANILDSVLKVLPGRTGYLQVFKQLNVGKEENVEHKLKAFPLVDVYQLDYFKVVCSEDGNKPYAEWVTFYLYHSSEKRIRLEDGTSIPIEPIGGTHPYKVPFKDLLEQYHVKYTDNSSLGDLETEFWKAFFTPPNDDFDDDQHCHSPWFDRCCRESKTVGELKSRGDWDDLWLQMRPRKTINYPEPVVTPQPTPGTEPLPTPAPTQIQIAHFDYDTLGITLLSEPVHPTDVTNELSERRNIRQELKVMLLLKV
ncbi:hypothetical protein [Myxacorys almedinensis]|uniref:Uncharacterized protein n=1 Tax=Myxacorys almedinensis A TaxID=2690445 RepID=A0A8J7Z2U8_9CYAN|nr:hypothetical protein [Myxacorys almedinensis]NDJ19012.1 hypothetical protein [Myxacorys almedinensis A]